MEDFDRGNFVGKDGRRYDLVILGRDSELFVVRAYYSGRFVGKINGVVHDDGRMLLGDVHIHDAVELSPSLLTQLWRRIVPARPISYRGNGLGSHLLGRFLAEARARGVREVYGNVTPTDLATTPGLFEWYARCGFAVDQGAPSSIRGAWVIRCPLKS